MISARWRFLAVGLFFALSTYFVATGPYFPDSSGPSDAPTDSMEGRPPPKLAASRPPDFLRLAASALLAASFLVCLALGFRPKSTAVRKGLNVPKTEGLFEVVDVLRRPPGS